ARARRLVSTDRLQDSCFSGKPRCLACFSPGGAGRLPSKPESSTSFRRGFAAVRVALAVALLSAAPADAQERPAAAMLLDRLCAQSLRPNEEDRLFGLISLTVRTTIKYQNGIFSPDLIDDAVQDSLGAITGACPQLAATDDFHRLGKAIELARDATLKRLQDPKADYNIRQTERATAA